jgi:hypothetical protein
MVESSRNNAKDRAESAVLYQYPLDHWQQLLRFVEGQERDPRNLFCLSDDIWDAWPYASSGRPTEAATYRFRFGHLRSFLKPYVKWYCYQRLVGSGKRLTGSATHFPYAIGRADSYLLAHEISALDELASPTLFTAFWESLLIPHHPNLGPRPKNAVRLQSDTRAFWEHLRVHFGAPTIIPPTAPHIMRKPVEFSHDEQQVIPLAVIRQLVNRLALHRDERERLNHYDHLRLCVLLLVLCLGRRIDEVLAAPRGIGPDGPLHTYPASGDPPEEAQWFQFHPNKQGPKDLVYISPEWKDLVRYCVQTLCSYSDEVRSFADPSEQHLFILISWSNGTSGAWATRRRSDRIRSVRQKPSTDKLPTAGGLSQKGFATWLRGNKDPRGREPGILTRWKITTDGTTDGAIYQLRTHQARHTRQTALAKDPQISLLTRQRDLNHRHRDMQFAYQHTLSIQHQSLLEKAKTGLLFGPATNWLTDLLKVQYQTPSQHEEETSSQFHAGRPALLDERWRDLLARSPHFLQFSRVPCGYCTLPQGPEGCREYMHCLEATDEGCQWFVTDPLDEQLLMEIQDRASFQKQRNQNSLQAGRTIQAQKYEVLTRRAEGMEDEVLRRSSQELRERMIARKQELERDSHATTNES